MDNSSTPSKNGIEFASMIRANIVPLSFLFGLKIPILLTAILLSISPIYLTLKSKTLRSNCNFLISLNFLNTAIQLPAAMISATVVLSGQIQIRRASCFPLQIVPYIGATMQWAICFAIALDRIVGLFFPFFYLNYFGRKRRFLVLVVVVCYAYTLYKANLAFNYSMLNPENLVICGTTDIYPSQNTTNVLQNLCINIATASCYIFLWTSLRCKINHQKQHHSPASDRVSRCVSALMLLDILGWFTNNLLRLILPLLQLNPLNSLYFSHCAAYLLYFALGAQAPVLYIFGKEYREAFERELPLGTMFRNFCNAYFRVQPTVATSASDGVAPTQLRDLTRIDN